MTVSALRAMLDDFDDDAEVRLMIQPSWPFEYSIAGLWESAPQPDACGICGWPENAHDVGNDNVRHSFEDYERDRFEPNGSVDDVVYIVQGSQLAYGTDRAWGEELITP